MKSAAEYVCAREDRLVEESFNMDIWFEVTRLACGVTQAPRWRVREWREKSEGNEAISVYCYHKITHTKWEKTKKRKSSQVSFEFALLNYF